MRFHLSVWAERPAVPYTVYAGERPDDGTWNDDDRTVAEAWRIFQNGVCGRCGVHAEHGHDIMQRPRWGVTAKQCQPCRTIEKEQERQQQAVQKAHQNKGSHDFYGSKIFPKDLTYEMSEIPGLVEGTLQSQVDGENNDG